MDRSRVAIIIPAFNEDKSISKVVKQGSKYGQVIVIDDGSKDKTGEKAKVAGAIVETHNQNLGYDFALNTGFKKAKKLKCKYLLTIDADGQHEMKLIKKFINELDTGVSMVLGVRNKKARLSESLFSFFSNIRYGVNDPLCGLKAYKIENYNLIGYFDKYNSIGTEFMFRSIFLGKSYKQINFIVRDRDGEARFGNSIRANIKILRSLIFFILKKYS